MTDLHYLSGDMVECERCGGREQVTIAAIKLEPSGDLKPRMALCIWCVCDMIDVATGFHVRRQVETWKRVRTYPEASRKRKQREKRARKAAARTSIRKEN